MWHYFIPHAVFHLMRWFPKNNRIKIRVLLILCVLCVLIPEIYVLVNPRSTRFCAFPLFNMLATGICFTFFMIGFSILFALMDPVPYQLKMTFHVFGGCTFLYSIIQAAYGLQAQECGIYSEELYWFELAEGILCILCISFFLLTVPFWIANKVWKNSVLDEEFRTGLCYEPVNCCTCIWHVWNVFHFYIQQKIFLHWLSLLF